MKPFYTKLKRQSLNALHQGQRVVVYKESGVAPTETTTRSLFCYRWRLLHKTSAVMERVAKSIIWGLNPELILPRSIDDSIP